MATQAEADLERQCLAGPPPLVDVATVEELRSLGDGSASAMAEIVAFYRDDARRLVVALAAAAEARDVDRMSRLGHELAGSSVTIGATLVAERARALKDAARDADFAAVAGQLPQLEGLIIETCRVLGRLVGS